MSYVVNTSSSLTHIDTIITKQTTVLQKININAEEEKTDKNTKINSIHPSCQKMILTASLEDGTNTPTVLPIHCIDFFKQNSEVHAQIHIN